ncbi:MULTISPECIES: AEC family transporter [Paraburkholderia]|jgi:malonate transporter|uniref:AEC family transporter n=1 Tax=Paraburkholderia TaxID=1822464 RepID=UPI001EE2974E|nr:AEC family transporter [Paraburkholderia terrae]GJG99616.1 AEC family transporter [Paraburkholderia terrae]GJH32666.1 AEC family transporter [Paraburkholderia hospita]
MHIAGLILPIFAIILTGWLARISGYLPHTVAGPLMQFAYYVAMPALVFLTVAKEPLESLLEWRFLAAFGAGSLICFAAALIVARTVLHASLGKSAMLGAIVSMTNTGFVALPILRALQGQHGVLAAAVATVFVGAIMFPALVVLLEVDQQTGSRKMRGGALAKQIGTNPVILATILGLLWSVGGLTLPAPAVTYLGILGEALTPCALFAIGLDLSIDELRGHLSRYALLAALKLIVMPLVVYGLCVAVGLNRATTLAAVICAAVPTAKSAYVLAVEYDVEKTSTGAAISTTTLFSIVTLLAWLYLL